MSPPIARRHAVAGIAAFGLSDLASRICGAQAVALKSPAGTLAEQLAIYADNLRFEDLDPATIERV